MFYVIMDYLLAQLCLRKRITTIQIIQLHTHISIMIAITAEAETVHIQLEIHSNEKFLSAFPSTTTLISPFRLKCYQV